jgi:hypothetical protein
MTGCIVQYMIQMDYFYKFFRQFISFFGKVRRPCGSLLITLCYLLLLCSGVGARCFYSPSCREGSHSRKPTVASPATTIPFYGAQSTVTGPPATFSRDIATPAGRICYEKLQVVAAELPKN